MAHKTHVIDLRQREQRQRDYSKSNSIADQFPGVREVVLEIRFTQVDNKPLLSPYKQIYIAQMQAFFELLCPSKDCANGGFDLNDAVARAAAGPDETHREKIRCRGTRTDSEAKGQGCPVEMQVSIEIAV